MKFDIGQLFLGISKVTINDLEILPCEDFYFPTDDYQIHCILTEFEDTPELHESIRVLNQNLQKAKEIKDADSINFTFVDQSSNYYDFVFRDVYLQFSYSCDKILLVIDFNPTKFEIKMTKNVIEMYKEIVDELILLHQKHNTDDYVNVSHVQDAALTLLNYQIEEDRLIQ